MHIPDNYLSPATCGAFGIIMLPIWKRATTKIKNELTRKKMPLLGICAAFSFLIMMFNLPLPGGTTGHAIGAVLIALLLGPYSAIIAVTIALAIQALFFGDGGILAFGANCFNMAFVMPVCGYYIFKLISRNKNNSKLNYFAAFAASYLAINMAALCAAIEFGIQPLLFKGANGMPLYCPYGLSASIPAMLLPHLLIVGVVEGIVTAGVYAYVKKASPEIIYNTDKPVSYKPLYVLLVIMIVLVPIGLLASGTAWGEWGNYQIKKIFGYIPRGMGKGFSFNALLSDYSIEGIPEIIGYVISAILGTALLIGISKLINKFRAISNEK